jgi:TatA/E family protein of Tat protein translocase
MAGPDRVTRALVIALLVFGPKKLPDLGRSIRGGMREFKNSITRTAERDELPAGKPEAAP